MIAPVVDDGSVVVGRRVGPVGLPWQWPLGLLWIGLTVWRQHLLLIVVLVALIVIGIAVAAVRARIEVGPNGLTVVGIGRRVWAWDDLELISPWMHDQPQVRIHPKVGRAVSFHIWQRSKRRVKTDVLIARAAAGGVPVGIRLEAPSALRVLMGESADD